MIGTVVGGALIWNWAENDGPIPPIRRPEGLLQASQALPPEFRPIIREAVQTAVRELRPEIEKVREARLEVARLLVEPTLDPTAFETALANGRAADLGLRTGLDKALIEAALQLPAAERQALATSLRQASTSRAGATDRRD